MSRRLRGTIVTWNDERGFGFIGPAGGGKDLFFHISDVRGTGVRPQEYMQVSCIASLDDRGRPCAADVRLSGHVISADIWPVLVALLFVLGIGALTWSAVLPPWVVLTYLVMSAVTLLFYRADKARATSGGWRTPERVLHTLELAGGWPGALVAQWHYHHKNRKASYQVSFWLIVAINVALLAWLATAGGG